MKTEDRKSATAAYKDTKRDAGIFAIRCTATGQCWVGTAPDLATIQNRIWFTLKHGTVTTPGLKAAWTEHGEAAVTFEILEILAEEEDAYIRGKLLQARAVHWREALSALSV